MRHTAPSPITSSHGSSVHQLPLGFGDNLKSSCELQCEVTRESASAESRESEIQTDLHGREDSSGAEADEFESRFHQEASSIAPVVKAFATNRTDKDAVLNEGVKFPLKSYTGPKLTLWNVDALHELNGAELGITDDGDRRSLRELFEHLFTHGPDRKLRCLPPHWKDLLDELEGAHPNLSEVVNYLRYRFALASAQDGVISFEPILLVGGPGVGKSMFADKLSRLFGSGFVCVRMENAQSNSVLAGSETFWSNSKPGKVFDTLIYRDYANPVFYLDEIDKISGDHRYDPASALYSLLEPDTAREFTDNCRSFIKVDASRILWIATANDTAKVPDPILSRLRVFEIPDLNYAQSLSVAQNIAQQACNVLPPSLHVSFEAEALQVLSQFAPRKMKQMVREAIGRALYEGRRHCCAGDIPTAALKTRKLGFV
jgi:ATP-dependent Lon protease